MHAQPSPPGTADDLEAQADPGRHRRRRSSARRGAGSTRRGEGLGRRRDVLPADPDDRRHLEALGKVAGVEGERPCRQQRLPSREPRRGKERGARRRPLAVDARQAVRRCGRSCTGVRPGQVPSGPGGHRHVRHQSRDAHRFLGAAGRRTQRARLTERRRRRRDDALRRDRQVRQVVRRRDEQRPSRHRGDRRQRDAKHRHARERDPRRPRGRRPRLRRRDREPPVQSRAAEATRARYGR
jgi:hypothetical protein